MVTKIIVYLLLLISMLSSCQGAVGPEGAEGMAFRNVRTDIIFFTKNALKLEREINKYEKEVGYKFPKFSTFSIDFYQKYAENLGLLNCPPEMKEIKDNLVKIVEYKSIGEIDKAENLRKETYRTWAQVLKIFYILPKEEGFYELVDAG